MIAAVDLAALQRAFFLPAELGKTAVERLAIVAAVAFGIDRRAARLQPRQPVRHFRGANQVAPPHLGAVDPEVARRQFDQPLAEERALVAAGRAIGAGWRLVGQQRRHGHPHVRHAIWTGEGLREGARLNQAIGAHIGAEIDEDLAAHPEDRAVAFGRRSQSRNRPGARGSSRSGARAGPRASGRGVRHAGPQTGSGSPRDRTRRGRRSRRRHRSRSGRHGPATARASPPMCRD